MYPKPTNLPRYFYRLVSTGEPDDLESDYEQLITGEHVVSNDLCTWFLTNIGPQGIVKCQDKFVFVGEDGNTLESMPLSPV